MASRVTELKVNGATRPVDADPERSLLSNQVEGCLIIGLGAALFEAIRFENGKILNPRFSRYPVPRFGDIPQIDVVLRDRKDLPAAGGGETPIVAIANAIYSATGNRLRSMPLVPQGVVKS